MTNNKKRLSGEKEITIDAFSRPSGRGYTLHHVGCTEEHPPQYKEKEPLLGAYITCKCGTNLIVKREKSLWS